MKATSERKITANRANAGGSTGPKTAHGRTHSARNALRHALSLPVYSDKALCAEVEALARGRGERVRDQLDGRVHGAHLRQRAIPVVVHVRGARVAALVLA